MTAINIEAGDKDWNSQFYSMDVMFFYLYNCQGNDLTFIGCHTCMCHVGNLEAYHKILHV